MSHKLCCLTCIDLLFKLTCPTGLQSEAKLLNRILKRCWLCKNVLILYLLSTCQTFFPLHQTYFKTICSFMHDFVNDLAPSNISELFRYSSEKHYHYTRSSAAGNLCFKYSRTKHKKNSFSRLGARLWNSNPICLLSRPKYKFKWYT